MKKLSIILSVILMAFVFTACGEKQPVKIHLSDDDITVDGKVISTEETAVYASNDIVFYLENQGSDYGEGEKDEEHSQAEADKHTVINITQPGDYEFSGKLSAGQIAVNLGKDRDKQEKNKVNIILNNVDITNTVAPAIICYSAYECGDDDIDNATKDVDTANAGFNITLGEGSVNNVQGGHVAKIFDEKGKKLHKYDAAIESLVSLNIGGNGTLNVTADNEGIETKLHMTINGGEININSRDDSLNAGEDGVSVITINDGRIYCNANNGIEGDGIDSNGWLIINGGMVSSFACEKSMDSGLDSDNGIYINGGTVLATGSMYDNISKDSSRTVAVFNSYMGISKEDFLVLESSAGDMVAGFNSPADSTVVVYSSPLLTEDDYTLYKAESIDGDGINGIYANITSATGKVQLAHSGGTGAMGPMGGRPQGRPPKEFEKGDMPDFKGEMPEFNGERPQPPQDFAPDNLPEGFDPNNLPQDFAKDENGRPVGFGGKDELDYSAGEANPVFTITKGVNMFRNISLYNEN